eukprot:6213325-Pleurochrysis_carterae.AAC.1
MIFSSEYAFWPVLLTDVQMPPTSAGHDFSNWPSPLGHLQRLERRVYEGTYGPPVPVESLKLPNLDAYRRRSTTNIAIRRLLKIHFVSTVDGALFQGSDADLERRFTYARSLYCTSILIYSCLCVLRTESQESQAPTSAQSTDLIKERDE